MLSHEGQLLEIKWLPVDFYSSFTFPQLPHLICHLDRTTGSGLELDQFNYIIPIFPVCAYQIVWYCPGCKNVKNQGEYPILHWALHRHCIQLLGMKTHSSLSSACNYSISAFCPVTIPKSCIYSWHKERTDISMKSRQISEAQQPQQGSNGNRHLSQTRLQRAWDLPRSRWKQAWNITWALSSGFFWCNLEPFCSVSPSEVHSFPAAKLAVPAAEEMQSLKKVTLQKRDPHSPLQSSGITGEVTYPVQLLKSTILIQPFSWHRQIWLWNL